MNSGRPCSYTEAKAARIVEAIRKGLPLKLAAAAGGVSFNTFVRWRNDGAKPGAPAHFRDFLHLVRQAEAEAATRFMGLIEQSAQTSWQAAAWMLERRHPDLFGKDAKPPATLHGNFEMPIYDED